MLRLCVQGARGRRRPGGAVGRWLSSLPGAAQTSADEQDDGRRHGRLPRAGASPPALSSPHRLDFRRRLGVSRHLDPLARPGPLNTLDDDDDVVPGDDGAVGDGDDMEAVAKKVQELSDDYWDDYGGGPGRGDGFDDIFGDFGPDGEDGEKSAAAEYNERQAALASEFAQRKGRLWDDEWVIPDDEWLKNETWDDIEEWRPGNATRVSVESVKVYEGGVPTLGAMSGLELPPPLPKHPGDGDPADYAGHRKREMSRRLKLAVQVTIHDDLKKILEMKNWEDKQDAVDEMYETIEGRVREREPIMGQLPDFAQMVEKELEGVLRMAQSRLRGASAAEKEASAAEGGDAEVKEGEETNPEPTKVDDSVLDVMDSKKEKPVPIFMDLLAIGGKKSKSGKDEDDADTKEDGTPALSEFLSGSNDKGVPNLIYPLNVHHDDGTGRMVEEWELAAKKDTKRIMMRSAMKEVAGRIVEATNCCGDGEVKDEEKGSARVLVTGRNGNGKVSADTVRFLHIPSW